MPEKLTIMKAIKTIALLLTLTTIVAAQNISIQKTDAEIINEINEIKISSKKLEFIHFSFYKTIEVAIKSEKGKQFFEKIVLPENYDPSFIYHAPEMRNYQYLLSDVKYKNFSVQKIHGNDTIDKNFELTDSLIKMVNEQEIFGNHNTQTCSIENIAVGETLLIKYNYSAKYAGNFNELSCFRVFLNGNIYKNNYTLKLSHHEDLRTEFKFGNFENNETIDTVDEIVKHTWTTKNLEPCISEPGSIPYTELPNITIIPKPVELIYTIPASWQEAYMPFYVFPVYQREKGHFGILESIKEGATQKQYSLLYKFVEKYTKDIQNDSLGYITLQSLHNKIVDDFKYQNDYGFFTKMDVRRDRLGEFLAAETMRDIARYDTYVAVVLKAKLGYLTAYPVDRRVGEISDDYFRSMFKNDYFIAAFLNNGIPQYILPKKHEFGYYLNEFPFYYENTNVRLVSLFDYLVYKRAINDALRVTKTPASSSNDNVRMTNSMVKVSLDSLTTEFMTKVNLAGQYSTMTRGSYLYDYQDKTVNPLYAKKVWDIEKDVELQKKDIKVVKKIFPFNSAVSASYKSKNILSKTANGYALNLKNWFNHVIYGNMEVANRQTAFYPDFLGRDTYNYMLQFDKEVEIVNSLEKITINNDFAELIIEITQLSPNQIRISSVYSVIAEKVPAEKIQDVKTVFDKIEKLNNYTLKLKEI